jgi:CheY-like chemotaxis protein
MPTGLTRVLVILSQLEQAVGVQRLLKPLGVFDVRPFTSAEHALSYVQDDGTPDLAILDVRQRGMKVTDLMAALRQRRPDLPIILVGASEGDAAKVGAQAGLEGTRGRDLLPHIRRLTIDKVAVELAAPPAPTPRTAQPTEPDRPNLPTQPTPPPSLSERLAQDEPPAPTPAEGATVRDAVQAATPPDQPSAPVVEVAGLPERFDEDDADLDPTPPPPPSTDAPKKALGRRRTPKSDREPRGTAPLTLPESLAAHSPEEDAARQALRLTQAATGSTAAAVILTKARDLIAHVGEMPAEEVGELREVLRDDWEPTGKGSRIRFVTLPTSRQDYLLISRRAADGFTLSLAFAGDVPLSDIRQQSEHVAHALEHAPEPDAVPVPALPVTVIWVLRDPTTPLSAEDAQAIVLQLDAHLNAEGWRIHNLNVHADYVYVYCDAPLEASSGEVVTRLRDLSEQAVRAHGTPRPTAPLWSDSYLTLMPGREMGADEVRRFLRFCRLTPKAPEPPTP